MTETPPAMPAKNPGGRRKGGTSTREAILRAAVEVFAEHGYEGSTLRAITSKAGVDVALVSHFFGGKQGLFDEAVLRHGEANLRMVLDAEPGDDPARQLIELYFSMWENPDTALSVRALFRAAMESEDHRTRLQALMNDNLATGLRALAQRRGDSASQSLEEQPEEATLRTQLLAAHLLGVGFSRYIMQLSPIADVPKEELVDRLAPILEAYLPGEPTSPAA